jgi:hypothetical protein
MGRPASSAPSDTSAPADASDESGGTNTADPSGARGRRRGIRIGVFALAATLVAGLAWLVITALMARSELNHVRAQFQHIRSAVLAGDTAKARSLTADAQKRAARAHALVSGPAWWTAAEIPWAGTPVNTMRRLATAVDEVGSGALPSVGELDAVLHDPGLRRGTTIKLALLKDAASAVARASASTDDAARTVGGAAHSTWLSPVDSARESLAAELAATRVYLSGAERTLRLAIPMLGEAGPRRYFIGFMNEAEARGLGGLPGAFGILTANHGTIQFTHFGNDGELGGARADVRLGADYEAMYGSADPAGTFPNSDISPDFRDAARIWAGMWQAKSGQQVDGAIAIDPTALSYLLGVTGPLPLISGGRVSADNIVAITQQTQYAMIRNNTARKKYIVDVAIATFERLAAGADGLTSLAPALARAAKERRFDIWSDRRGEEDELIAAGYAGALPSGVSGPVTGFVTVNTAGSKLDYYAERALTYTRTGCGPQVNASATVRLTNTAPRAGLPGYVTIRGDRPDYPTKPGDNRVTLTYFATEGARVTSATLDGKPVYVAIGSERGLTTASVDVELPAGQARVFAITLREPRRSGQVRVVAQPAVNPTQVRTAVTACG